MDNINNIEVYTDGMKKSLLDKMFFMDKINSDTFIDYGCADGTMLKFMSNLFNDYKYFGFDISKQMLQLAQKDYNGDIEFTDDWKQINTSLGDNSTLILSSIIHEVYTYGSLEDINTFWDRVFHSGFKYIVIRDMMLSNTSDRETDINDMLSVKLNTDIFQLFQFEDKWGKITNNKNLIHYLLKYRYIHNWDRENQENYLPLTVEHFSRLIPKNYKIVFYEHYTLPFLKERVAEDFNIVLKDNTHMKIILKLK